MTRKKLEISNYPEGTILIPDLEEAIARGDTGKFGHFWSEREEAVLKTYYGRVDTKILKKYLPRKTIGQIQSKASRMGITRVKA